MLLHPTLIYALLALLSAGHRLARHERRDSGSNISSGATTAMATADVTVTITTTVTLDSGTVSTLIESTSPSSDCEEPVTTPETFVGPNFSFVLTDSSYDSKAMLMSTFTQTIPQSAPTMSSPGTTMGMSPAASSTGLALPKQPRLSQPARSPQQP